MKFSAQQIAALIKGKTDGDASVEVSGFSKIEEATPGNLAFLANPKYEDHLYSTQASIVIVNEALVLKKPVNATLIRVPDAYTAFASLLDAYQQMQTMQLTGIEQPAFIHPTAKVGDNVYLGAFVYIGENAVVGDGSKLFPGTFIGKNAVVGTGTVLHAGVKLYNDCSIGNNVIVHAGSVIGSDGFGFAPQADGSLKKVPQIGNVIIEDQVEIGANATIDRATMGSTIIRTGAKIDNMVQIAHNVEVGASTVIAAQTGISGSTRIGKGVQIGGQAGLVGHIQIADGARINAQSGVSKSIKVPGTAVTGTPASDYTANMRIQAMVRKLPELEKRIADLEKLLKEREV